MIRIGIIGGAGYTAGELIRLLLNHPDAEIVFGNSTSHAGDRIAHVHSGLEGDTDLAYTGGLPLDSIDLLFSCSAHGDTRKFLETHPLPAGLKVIDLSTDYRIKSEANPFVYGLPELNRKEISQAERIANPGCFATCIQLALLPLAQCGKLDADVHVHAVTGSTGAGVKPGATTHFSWRSDNLSVYKTFAHQHLGEIRQSLAQLQPGFRSSINFIPVRGNFARGIFATAYLNSAMELDEAQRIYGEYYGNHPFTFLVDTNPDLKQAVNTNKCLIHLQKIEGKLFIISIFDNLLKGASGQAVHNMNLLFGLNETTGLRLKPSAF